jgi:hypothetical protein
VRPAGFHLQPEKAQNLSAGFDWTFEDRFLKGLDIQATYWFVKIRNTLTGCTGALDDPLVASCFVTAATDPNFLTDVAALMAEANSTIPAGTSPASISFVRDGAIRNIGWQSLNGIDYSASYDVDLEDLGAWNTGVTGEYILDNKILKVPGQPVTSIYSTPVAGTTNSGGRMRYRARLGWAGGPDDAWSITGFMNFWSHFNTNTGALPPLCFLAGNPACDSLGLPQYAQYTQQFPTLSNLVPGIYTFDLSISYKTGDRPANKYLKNLGMTLTVNDVLDKRPPFAYNTGGGAPHAFYTPGAGGGSIGSGGSAFGSPGVDGRYATLTLTKSW